jgi:hypothetical protein
MLTTRTSSEELNKALADDYGGEDADVHSSKRPRKEEIQWTEQREYVLASLVKSKKAYIKTKNLKMEDKKLMVLNEIKNHPAFAGESHKLTVAGIIAKYNRMQSYVSAKYALEGEGSNLSGLPEDYHAR